MVVHTYLIQKTTCFSLVCWYLYTFGYWCCSPAVPVLFTHLSPSRQFDVVSTLNQRQTLTLDQRWKTGWFWKLKQRQYFQRNININIESMLNLCHFFGSLILGITEKGQHNNSIYIFCTIQYIDLMTKYIFMTNF